MNKNRKRQNDMIEIPASIQRSLDGIKRSIILDNDPVFSGNFRQLKEATQAGRVPESTSGNIAQWLIMSSMRRNHVSAQEARRLLRA